jgi:site-specific DNA-methyltransferase (adenine-specific)
MPKINIYNTDCMEFMKALPDKAYELAIVDPPYNVGASDGNFGGKSSRPSLVNGKINAKSYANHDKTPDKQYFDELFRISANQIIWGSNYYPQFLCHSGAIVWDKKNDNNHVLSDCEIAFQSFSKLVKIVRIAWSGFYKEDSSRVFKFRVHPNQKPVALYQWLLKNYAKQGDKILDTHGGSCSIAIACDIMGFDLDVCELDTDYYNAAVERFNRHKQQLKLDFTG